MTFLLISLPVVALVVAVALYADRYGRRAYTTEARERAAARHRHPSAQRRRRFGPSPWDEAFTDELQPLQPVTNVMAALPGVPPARRS